VKIAKGILIGIGSLIVILTIFIIIMESGSPSVSSKILINPELKQKIRTTYTTSKYYVSEVEDNGSILRITLTLQFTPRTEIQLGNTALPVCMEIVNLLKSHSLKRDVSVWLQKPTQTKGFTRVYGRAFYSTSIGTVEWIPYK
jgi:murein endopeptidase